MVAWDAWKAEIRRLESTQYIDKTQITYLLYKEMCRILCLDAERSALLAVGRITGASFPRRTQPGDLHFYDWLCIVDMASGGLSMGCLDASYFLFDRVCTDNQVEAWAVHAAYTEAIRRVSAEGSAVVATWRDKLEKHRIDEI